MDLYQQGRARPPGQLPDPPAGNKRQRKAPGAAAPRKRSKKGDAAEGTPGPGDSSGGTAAAGGGTPPPAKKPRPRSTAAAGGGKEKKDKEDELGLIEKDEERGVAEEPEEKLGRTHTGVFSKDLPWVMYGYGDADKPLKETAELVEDIAVQFITDTVHTAMGAAAARNPGTSKKDDLRLEDLMYAIRRDSRKVARIQEIIRRQQEIKNARRVIDEPEGLPDL
eukprot:GHRR01003455.1.p1 GENE.GHRR01003455.1~~GHRR01003455.1.p1  ORF type:complete len:222 (+),score=68.91 GHRR01003455.1:443-1108(+)